ncbi:MAG: hypothetical protein AVDCRST_MAG68-98, partial [uncultured Gemmatimonadetes bacterium]
WTRRYPLPRRHQRCAPSPVIGRGGRGVRAFRRRSTPACRPRS